MFRNLALAALFFCTTTIVMGHAAEARVASAAQMVVSTPPPSAPLQSVSTVFARVKASLAIVVTSSELGTGFCVASTPVASYYLTSQHVVGKNKTVIIFRQFPKLHKYIGTVVATGIDQDPDLALVRVAAPNIPRLALQVAVPTEGDAVITAGYPSAQYRLAAISGDLTPAVHLGTLSAVVNRGGLLEYDAQTLPGNSGGPLIDAHTGNVLGVVTWKIKESTDANIALGIARVVVPFLRANKMSYLTVSPSGQKQESAQQGSESATLRALPGADSVAVVYDTSRGTADAGPPIAAAAQDFAQKFGARFGVHTTVLDRNTASGSDLAKAAKAANSLFAIQYNSGFRVKSDNSNQYGTSITYAFKLYASIVDIYGFVWYTAEKSKDALTARGMYDAVLSSFADLNDQAITEIADELSNYGADESVSLNVFRYAMPIANGAKKGFVSYVGSPNGAIAHVFPFSPAVEAGLQTGDIVTSINGISLVNKSTAEVADIMALAYATGRVDLVVVGPDGKGQHIKFLPEDLRWYVEHRASSQ